MNGAVKLRIALIAGAVLLTAGIYSLPKSPKPGKDQDKEISERTALTSFSIEQYISDSKKKLGWDAGNKTGNWEKAIREKSASLEIYDSVSRAWDAVQNPGVSAWYLEQKSVKTGTESDWLNTAYRYFDAYKAAKDSLEAGFFVNKAIGAYTKVTELNPGNENAKTDLGVLYAEGTAEPMKGIMMLREVVQKNPDHENANLNLGFLSMKSGQHAKAIERFKKVLAINPSRIDMYVYIGEAYVRTGNKKEAIENFRIFRNLSNDQQMINDVDAYIKTLEGN
jgi:tetratricopeptide (TPR) repeat protein